MSRMFSLDNEPQDSTEDEELENVQEGEEEV